MALEARCDGNLLRAVKELGSDNIQVGNWCRWLTVVVRESVVRFGSNNYSTSWGWSSCMEPWNRSYFSHRALHFEKLEKTMKTYAGIIRDHALHVLRCQRLSGSIPQYETTMTETALHSIENMISIGIGHMKPSYGLQFQRTSQKGWISPSKFCLKFFGRWLVGISHHVDTKKMHP